MKPPGIKKQSFVDGLYLISSLNFLAPRARTRTPT